jgi:hypothetical protein
MYTLGLRKLSRANEELLSDASPEELQSLLSAYMQVASTPLPEDLSTTTTVEVTVLKPMASLAAQSLTRILSKRRFGGKEGEEEVAQQEGESDETGSD